MILFEIDFRVATHNMIVTRGGELRVTSKYKKSKGNRYKYNNEFAEEVLAKNTKHEVHRNPMRFGNK